MDTDLLYQRLGQFVVAFQWLENRLREIGWIILDHRKEWPPKQLRNLRNEELLIKVESLYVRLLDRLCSTVIEAVSLLNVPEDRPKDAVVMLGHDLGRGIWSALISLDRRSVGGIEIRVGTSFANHLHVVDLHLLQNPDAHTQQKSFSKNI